MTAETSIESQQGQEQQQQQLPVAEITGSARQFKSMFAAVEAVAEYETAFLLMPEGLKVQALAGDKAGLTSLDYPATAFENYSVSQQVSFAVRADDVTTVLGRTSDNKTQVVMKVDFEESKLLFTFNKKTFKCKMVDSKAEIKPINLSMSCRLETSIAAWDDLLGDFMLEGKGSKEISIMSIEVKGGIARFWRDQKKGTEYETVKESAAVKENEKPDGNAWVVSGDCEKTEFNTEKLALITKAIKSTTERITINLAPKNALRLDFDEGYISFWLGSLQEKK